MESARVLCASVSEMLDLSSSGFFRYFDFFFSLDFSNIDFDYYIPYRKRNHLPPLFTPTPAHQHYNSGIGVMIGTLRLTRACFTSRKPIFRSVSAEDEAIKIVHPDDASTFLPPHRLTEFLEKKAATAVTLSGEGSTLKEATTKFYSNTAWKKIKDIPKNTSLYFSPAVQSASNFAGLASEILTRGYKFSRKEKAEKTIEVGVEEVVDREYILELANAKIQAAEWAASRGNERNTEQLVQEAQRIATAYPSVRLTIIRGNQLLEDGFTLLHAVGRASKNEPAFVSLEWRGGREDEQFVGLVGKGLCFDSGGLNLKPTSGISGMHNDKHGACSVLSAFESAVRLKLPVNLVAVVGLAENFVSSNSYRPLDIIRSRKGLTVEIGNTDAEGRLVLADCMHWVQQNYKVGTLLELSTLTGAIIVALGKERAGLFSNSPALTASLLQRGQEAEELLWHMPVDDYHAELIKPKCADLTNSAGKPDGASCQAAAFLRCFVEKGVEWAHIDIAGVAGSQSSTGYGAKLLLHYLRSQKQV